MQSLDNFYQAENYHQKYQLRLNKELYNIVFDLFKTEKTFIDSHLATKLNSYSSNLIEKENMKDIINSSYLKLVYPNKINELIKLIGE